MSMRLYGKMPIDAKATLGTLYFRGMREQFRKDPSPAKQ